MGTIMYISSGGGGGGGGGDGGGDGGTFTVPPLLTDQPTLQWSC